MESRVSTHLETPAEDCIVVKLYPSDGNPDSDHLSDEAPEDDFPAEKAPSPAQASGTERRIAELDQRLSSRLAALETKHKHLVVRGKVLERRQRCTEEPGVKHAEKTNRIGATHHAETQTQHACQAPAAPQAPSSLNNRGVTNINGVAIKDALIRSKDALIARQATFIQELEEAQQRLERGLVVANDQIALLSEFGKLFMGY